jgi:hypothetical protein
LFIHFWAASSDQRIVQGLQEQGHVVAFVGDGLNDTLAMAAADVGVAVGQSYRFLWSLMSCIHFLTNLLNNPACFWTPLMLCLRSGASATSQLCFISGKTFFVFIHLNILTDSPCFYPPYLQPRNFQTHFDEHRVGHPVQLSHDPPRRWHVLPKVRNTPASHVI